MTESTSPKALFFVKGEIEPIVCSAAVAPRTGIVCVKFYSEIYKRWFRVFGFEFYWFCDEEAMWYGAHCECVADKMRAQGRIVLAGKQCLFSEFEEIMERSKCP